MIIKVTEEDIIHGCPCDSTSCPVARAIDDVLKDGFFCTATMWRICIDSLALVGLRAGWACVTPEPAQIFIRDFDISKGNSSKFGPFEFELNIPKEYLKKEQTNGA